MFSFEARVMLEGGRQQHIRLYPDHVLSEPTSAYAQSSSIDNIHRLRNAKDVLLWEAEQQHEVQDDAEGIIS